MTRQQLQQYFPDTYSFFYRTPDTHPFWKAIQHVHVDDAKSGMTLLSDMEQVFSALYLVDGHHVMHEQLEDIDTHEQLMDLLTQLYVAYLYRNHKPRIISAPHGYNIEIEIADQLLALGVVNFHNFDSPQLQFATQIEDELHYLHTLHEDGSGSDTPIQKFVHHLGKQAKRFTQHPKAHHQVLAAMTNHSELNTEVELAKHIKESPEQMRNYFPHIAGVILIDPTSGHEQAKFIPFHGDHHQLELLLNKHP